MFKVNCGLACGASIMVAQFLFVTCGTYFYYSWDVMEPLTYLMMLTNCTVAFGYYGFKHRELDQATLQRFWFLNAAKKMYGKVGFDLDAYEQLKEDVLDLKKILQSNA